MNVSFIVTTYNLERYIGQCLQSLHGCLRPGDQVILVDDGSTDRTEEVVAAFVAEGGLPAEVEWCPIWLGCNTIGGVGIPANIGLDHAQRDVVFFVDGDDYMIPDAFLGARAAMEAQSPDILIADYLEYDEAAHRTKRPADADKWPADPGPLTAEARRLAALSLIAVPWRKFYRNDFLRRHDLRFPEGDFFFEDNPFHWQVCTAARSIAFVQRVICHHRVNRPGQTMASTGRELVAFFDHFQTIRSALPPDSAPLRRQAARWLVGNMSWHIPRLRPDAFLVYARRAVQALGMVNDADWQALEPEYGSTMVWHHAAQLRRGESWAVVESWQTRADREARQRMERAIQKLGEQVGRLQERLASLEKLAPIEKDIRQMRELLHAQQAIEEFRALRALSKVNGSERYSGPNE